MKATVGELKAETALPIGLLWNTDGWPRSWSADLEIQRQGFYRATFACCSLGRLAPMQVLREMIN